MIIVMNMIPFVMPWCGQTLGMPKSYVQDAGECTAQQTHLTSIGKGSRAHQLSVELRDGRCGTADDLLDE